MGKIKELGQDIAELVYTYGWKTERIVDRMLEKYPYLDQAWITRQVKVVKANPENYDTQSWNRKKPKGDVYNIEDECSCAPGVAEGVTDGILCPACQKASDERHGDTIPFDAEV